MPTLNAAKVSAAMLEKGQSRVIDDSLTTYSRKRKAKGKSYLFLSFFLKSVFV